MTARPEIGIATALIRTEKLATITAPRPIQIEWLDKIESVLQKLCSPTSDHAAFDQAGWAIATLHSQLTSPQTQDDDISSGWLQVIVALLSAAASIGADTGELVEVLSLFVQSCGSASKWAAEQVKELRAHRSLQKP
jgi:hypothetical protein